MDYVKCNLFGSTKIAFLGEYCIENIKFLIGQLLSSISRCIYEIENKPSNIFSSTPTSQGSTCKLVAIQV